MLGAALDERALEILDRRRGAPASRRRGWLVRRVLLLADVTGLLAAFVVAELLFGARGAPGDRADLATELAIFLAALPVWIIGAKISGLYDRDDERAFRSTLDELVEVFHVVTAGTWFVFLTSWLTGLVKPEAAKVMVFWIAAIALVTMGRAAGRAACRQGVAYVQNTVVVGAGDVGQLVARKVLRHPEYGLNIVGFVDGQHKETRPDLGGPHVVGTPEQLPEIVRLLDVERVVIAFSNDSHEDTLALIRSLRDLDVQVDVVPRLFEVIGPKVAVHTIEELPLVGLPPARLSRSSRAIKRAIDVVGALGGLVVTAPLFACIAWRVKRDSPGPVFFRQTRLGMNMREFTTLKFRTMAVGTDDAPHREYIKRSIGSGAYPGSNGLYKLSREGAVTPFGKRLRETSLDELPQLINVLRGEMSLVGPRPCIPYETESFAPHHFERFLVPAGLTGLWQVAARAQSTFGEALDMDVAYAHNWSLGLDLRLLVQTPLQLIRRVTA